jgi:hypothetical protein
MSEQHPEKHYVSGVELMALYHAGDYTELCRRLYFMCLSYEGFAYTGISREDQLRLDDTVNAIFYIFAQQNFQVPTDWVLNIVRIQHLLCNVIACSAYKTADAVVKHLLNQQDNLIKLLALYSVRCERILDPEIFFELNPHLASLWWLTYGIPVGSTVTKRLFDNLTTHFASIPDKFLLTDARTTPAYFDCTYNNNACDHIVKRRLNSELRKLLPQYRSLKKPTPGKIAWITGRWFSTSAVYKASYDYAAKLAEKYDVTLIHTGADDPSLVTKPFKRVINLEIKDLGLDLAPLKDADFEVAILYDVGMSNESIILSNLPIAPIMVASYGHPSSTWGSLCQYFIGGVESEQPDLAAQNYSERLVLIPGTGQIPVWPTVERKYPDTSKDFVINCPWTSTKLNYELLCAVKRIISGANRKVKLQIFPAFTLGRYNNLIPTVQGLSEMFGDELVVMSERPYPEYFWEMEKGSFTLISHPFGGYNTVIDSLATGCPCIAIEGNRMYNRIAPAVMRQVGLDDLIAKDWDEYVDLAIRLINDPQRLQETRDRLVKTDVRSLICDRDEGKYFCKAIDFIRENHAKIVSSRAKGPFFIEK